MAIDTLTRNRIQETLFSERNIQLDLLRLDLIHPQVSGNKWYKLKYNIQSAKENGYDTLLSFGGAYSNHLHALAWAGMEAGMKTIGIVRGDEVNNETLVDCKRWGMSLQFITREDYRHRNEETFLSHYTQKYPYAYIIPEGGNNELGIKGCKEILQDLPANDYDTIAVSTGSGATSKGLALAMKPNQKLWCFSSFRNNTELEQWMKEHHSSFDIFPVYQYGAFGKVGEEVRLFKEGFLRRHDIELDFMYTAKMMCALYHLIQEGRCENRQKILVLHTGGVQGNRGVIP